MSQYLLSVHSVEGGEPGEPMTAEEIEATMARVNALEDDMKSKGTFVFGGRLTDPASATVVRNTGGQLSMTDGPFAEAKEHIGGFYIVEAGDLDEALEWAGRVVDTIGAPIEVRPFFQPPTG